MAKSLKTEELNILYNKFYGAIAIARDVKNHLPDGYRKTISDLDKGLIILGRVLYDLHRAKQESEFMEEKKNGSK